MEKKNTLNNCYGHMTNYQPFFVHYVQYLLSSLTMAEGYATSFSVTMPSLLAVFVLYASVSLATVADSLALASAPVLTELLTGRASELIVISLFSDLRLA
jgi:hypothetical protein